MISYYDDTAHALKVAKCNDAACAGGERDDHDGGRSRHHVGGSTSIAVGTDGFPVISYSTAPPAPSRSPSATIPLARAADETITIVDDPVNSSGRYSSIAMGADGFPVISYNDDTAGALKVAKCNDAACAGGDETITTVDDPANDVGRTRRSPSAPTASR